MSLDLTDWQNKKYTTRDGRPVRLLCVDAIGEWQIIGALFDERAYGGPREFPYVWDSEGKREHGREGLSDLINAKTKKEGWVNIYPKNSCIITQTIHDSEEKAKRFVPGEAIAQVYIEWEE